MTERFEPFDEIMKTKKTAATPASQPGMTMPDTPPIPVEQLEQLFPSGFTLRDEANALTAFAFAMGNWKISMQARRHH